ncbi:hypothetical protein BDQ17DRAFT_1336509 [Cyathus striatus]|nr:hypothetical protein BDQ17DRAFT_1336509 [Cyathus striatus]
MACKTRRTQTLAKDNIDTTPSRNTPEVAQFQQCGPPVAHNLVQETDHIKLLCEVSSPLHRRHQEEPLTFENSPLQTFSTIEVDDPFISLPWAHQVSTLCTPLRNCSLAHAPGSAELFPSPAYVSSIPGDTPLQMRTRGLGHSENLNHNRSSPCSPAGNKSGNKAKDVWAFYEENRISKRNLLCTQDRNYSTVETSLRHAWD